MNHAVAIGGVGYLDMIIQSHCFCSWVGDTWLEHFETQLWDVWLHKCFDATSFEDFKAKAMPKPKKTTTQKHAEVSEIYAKSAEILGKFKLKETK